MFKPLFLFALAILFFQSSFVLSQEFFSISNFDFLFSESGLNEELIKEVNSNIDLLPSDLLAIIQDKKVNVLIDLDDGSLKSYHLVFVGKKVKSIFLGSRQDADVEVRTNEKIVRRIVFSKDPFLELAESFNAGDVRLVGLTKEGKLAAFSASAFAFFVGFLNQLKSFFSNTFSFFS